MQPIPKIFKITGYFPERVVHQMLTILISIYLPEVMSKIWVTGDTHLYNNEKRNLLIKARINDIRDEIDKKHNKITKTVNSKRLQTYTLGMIGWWWWSIGNYESKCDLNQNIGISFNIKLAWKMKKKILWDFKIQMDRIVQVRRHDLLIVNKEMKICQIANVVL